MEETNNLIHRREKSFHSLIDSMHQIEENRIEFVKSLFIKNFANTEKIADLYKAKAISIQTVISNIGIENYEESNDEKRSKSTILSFTPLKCIQYEYE